jgi:cytoskeletal protein CcmA (bactofilin family)
MILGGPTVHVVGEVWSSADLRVEGTVEGPVWCEDGIVTILPTASVSGDIIARDVTVFGRVTGQIIATDTADLRSGASVDGAVIAPRFILHDGASYHGRVDPKRLEAALAVVRFQQARRDAV